MKGTRWNQIRLQNLMLLMVFVVIGFGVFINRVRCQRRTVAAIRNLGGRVSYDYEIDSFGYSIDDPVPPDFCCLRSRLGIDFFNDVAGVFIDGAQLTDSDIHHIKSLGELRSLAILNTNIEDDDVKELRRMSPDARFFVWPVPTDVAADLHNRLDAMEERIAVASSLDHVWNIIGVEEYASYSQVMGMLEKPGDDIHIFPRGNLAGVGDLLLLLRPGHQLAIVVETWPPRENFEVRSLQIGNQVWTWPVTTASPQVPSRCGYGSAAQ